MDIGNDQVMRAKALQTGTPASVDSPPTGFDQILAELSTDPGRLARPADEALVWLMSYGGRLAQELVERAQSDFMAELLEVLQDTRRYSITAEPGHTPQTVELRIWFDGYGKLWAQRDGVPAPEYPESQRWEVGYLSLPSHVFNQLTTAVDQREREEAKLRHALEGVLVQEEAEGSLSALVDAVHHSVQRVEAVWIYIDRALWCVMEGCATLVERGGIPGLLSRLSGRPLSEWSSTERFGVVALRALFLSGRSVRFEEFNGAHLTARKLLAFFDRLSSSYARRRGIPVAGDSADIFAWARAIRAAADAAVGAPWIRYRQINGLTYVKSERIAHGESDAESRELPAKLVELYERQVGRRWSAELSYEQVFSELASAALEQDSIEGWALPGSAAESPIEALVELIVSSAVVLTGADYGMSSALRDIGPLLEGSEAEARSAIHALKPPHFYTCVVAAPGLARQFGSSFRKHVFTAIQRRMQFNRWHFIAGNLPEAQVDPGRHYFYPPVVPDIAAWSDQRHGGHTRARVRYSVRAPGPDMGCQALRIGALQYRGFYDVRVARGDLPTFSITDMLLVRRHCLWMGVVWRAIIRRCGEQKAPVVVRGFHPGNGLELDERETRILRSPRPGFERPCLDTLPVGAAVSGTE